jgi:predicted RNase H-like HicB family nuclease
MVFMQVTFNVKLPALVKKEKHGRIYISSCPVLDVFSQGESRQKALDNLREALQLFFVSCFERGTLDAVLKSAGFRAIGKSSVKKTVPFPRKYASIDLPLPFQIPQKADPAEWRV